MQKDSTLFDTILKARSDVAELRNVISKINKLGSNLYQKLRDLRYTEDDFVIGAQTIIDEVYEGKIHLNDKREIA